MTVQILNGAVNDLHLEARRFGLTRALTREWHRCAVLEFRRRQLLLALVAGFELCLFIASGHFLFAVVAVTCIQAGAVEARRMRACGRYHRCRRSMEVIGE